MKKILFLLILTLIIVPCRVRAIDIVDGDLIRARGDVDVYIVKLVGEKKFKRLILNPEIFNQYGHLKWENIKEVSPALLNEYATSDLVRALNDLKVYKLFPNGDIGEKRWIKTADDFVNSGFDWEAIYQINNFERDYYLNGQDWVAPAPCCQPETPITPETPAPSTPAGRTAPITINVPGDYSTIQAAINAAIDGDTINVRSGTYNENLLINKSIKLIGEFPTSIIVDGGGNGNAITVSGNCDVLIQRIVAKSKDKYGIYCSGENVKLTIKNSTVKDSGRGAVAENGCELKMLNNLVYNNRNTSNTDGAGILIKNNFNYGITSQIINNTIDDNYHGIWSENSNLKVMNNIVTGNIGSLGGIVNTGIYHSGSGVSDNTFNNVYGNGQEYGGDAKAGVGSLVVYPRFIWPTQRDYRLQTGATEYSLCIDAGNPDHIYDDIVYSSNTARNDLGAYGGPDNIGWNP